MLNFSILMLLLAVSSNTEKVISLQLCASYLYSMAYAIVTIIIIIVYCKAKIIHVLYKIYNKLECQGLNGLVLYSID